MPSLASRPGYRRLIAGAVALLVVGLFSSSIVETNEAGNVQVKQAAITGELTCKLDPGMWAQMFGAIHTYKEASTFHFTQSDSHGDAWALRF